MGMTTAKKARRKAEQKDLAENRMLKASAALEAAKEIVERNGSLHLFDVTVYSSCTEKPQHETPWGCLVLARTKKEAVHFAAQGKNIILPVGDTHQRAGHHMVAKRSER